MIQIKNISFAHASETLYKDSSCSVPKNKKAGLVGLNGAGKSTLFDLIMKKEWPDEGRVIVSGSTHLVPQEVSTDPIQSKFDSIKNYLSDIQPISDERLKALLTNMEMEHIHPHENPNQLSGGQKTKLAILYAVLAKPDILLLDEPTNFLDTAGKKWVMHWLSQYKKTLVVISHDLKLLDKHLDKIIYINKQTKKFEEYTGTYSKFKKLKRERDRHLTRHIKNQQQKIKRMEKSVEKLRRSNVEKVIRQRVQLERRIERIKDTLPDLPKEVVRIKLQLPTPQRTGSVPIIVKNIAKSYQDHQVLSDVSFFLERGKRYALIGHNGAGKSTLIKIIMGLLEPDTGTIEYDKNNNIGYYSQEFESIDQNLRLFELVQDKTTASDGQIRSFLAKFMFPGDRFKQHVKMLSGGEKTRLSIALLMLKPHNILILDEPTTYLDTLSQKIILEALKEYQGTMLVTSHTPEFLKGLEPYKALLLPEERFTYWEPSYASRTAEY